ncbi:hypothetical protein F2Q70_00016387 [Brassica cretica]|uniref:Uncharacterized protein n=1 Tax=Brassica cretica TaxID=69181 RepID=A0A8S9I4N3_BRACR|nr:hypothetical protein F2Q70_00016387 [Brassica cretica]
MLRLASASSCSAPRASCLRLKTPFSEPHPPLPPCLVRHYHHLRRIVFFLCHLRCIFFFLLHDVVSFHAFIFATEPEDEASQRPEE